jgi:hypothetical protein
VITLWAGVSFWGRSRSAGASVGAAMVAALSTSAPGLVQGVRAALVVCACVALAGAVFAASVRVK